jgi:threonine dehydrogenase-like Zn-dependent dehydrogenase
VDGRVAVLTEPERLELQLRPVPEPRAGEALVRVTECGICGSDLKMYSGKHPVLKPPMVLGHEFYGTLEGSGELVTVFPTVGCGHCFNCLRGRPHLCPDMELIGGQRAGGLGEWVAVPEGNVLAIHPGVPPEARVLIEPLAVGVHAAARAAVDPEEAVLVLGAGPIGLFTALALRHAGVARILLADLSAERLALARRLGFEETLDAGARPPAEQVRAAVRPEGIDVAFDCVGYPATAAQVLASTCKGGRAVLVGLMPRELAFDGVLLQRGERALVGVQMYLREDFETAMAILAGGGLPDAAGLIRTYPLERVADAFSALQAGPTSELKAVVRP